MIPELFGDCVSKSEVKARFRELAQLIHPDANPGCTAATEGMQQINQEYGQALDALERRHRNRNYKTHAEAAHQANQRCKEPRHYNPKLPDISPEYDLSLSDRHAAQIWGKLLLESGEFYQRCKDRTLNEWYYHFRTAMHLSSSQWQKPKSKPVPALAIFDDFDEWEDY